MRRGASSWPSTRTTGTCCAAEVEVPQLHHCSLLPEDERAAPCGKYQASHRVHHHLPILLAAEQQDTSSSFGHAAAHRQGILPGELNHL